MCHWCASTEGRLVRVYCWPVALTLTISTNIYTVMIVIRVDCVKCQFTLCVACWRTWDVCVDVSLCVVWSRWDSSCVLRGTESSLLYVNCVVMNSARVPLHQARLICHALLAGKITISVLLLRVRVIPRGSVYHVAVDSTVQRLNAVLEFT